MKGDYEKELEYMNAVIANTTTEALIAELEKRRPCIKCARNGGQKCGPCFWSYAMGLHNADNFKEKLK